MSAPLSVALAQLVVLEMQQAEQLADTRAAIAAIEKLSPPPAAPAEVSVPRNQVLPSAPVRRTPRPATSTLTVLVRGHHGKAAAIARATALLRLIRDGVRVVGDLRGALPAPPGVSAHQHRQSIANALTRLKGEGFLVNGDDGWALTAKGRKRAAKEEP